MVSGEKSRPLRANIFMTRRCFKCNVLRILLSEFDEVQEKTSLGIKVSCCADGMSVVIMGAEHSMETNLII